MVAMPGGLLKVKLIDTVGRTSNAENVQGRNAYENASRRLIPNNL